MAVYWTWEKAGTLGKELTSGEIDQVMTWIDELESSTLSDLTLRTHYTAPQGSEANETLRKLDGLNALRLDKQRVVESGPVTSRDVTQYFSKGTLVTDTERIKAFLSRKGTKKKGENLTEISQTVNTYSAIWTLFAVQKADTHNQVFILNSAFTLTNSEWKEIFRYTLEAPCTAIVTTGTSKIPNGFTSSQLVAK